MFTLIKRSTRKFRLVSKYSYQTKDMLENVYLQRHIDDVNETKSSLLSYQLDDLKLKLEEVV